MDESHDPFVGDDALFDKRAQEMQKKMVRSLPVPQPQHMQQVSVSL